MVSKTPKYNAKVKALLDAETPGEKTCSITGRKWIMAEEDIERFRKFNVPPLKVAPETFTNQYMVLHTGFSWWWNTDVETGKPILTHIHPSRPFKVMNDKSWANKDFTEQGRDVDSRLFFDQLFDLATDVPQSAWRNMEDPINSIARISLGNQDSYFTVAARAKKSFYIADSYDVENCAEATWSSKLNDSYNLVRGVNISRSMVVRESRNCLNCAFIFDCRDCDSCFFSWNQRQAKFLWRNEQLSEGEWKKRWAELDLGSAKRFYDLMDEFKQQLSSEIVWPENFNIKSQNSTGEYLENCLDCERSWYCDGMQRGWWSVWGSEGAEDSALGIDYRSNNGFGNPAVVDSSQCRFSILVNRSQRLEYCIECHDCEDCFGCVGLKRKKFCILNKQYTEQEYWQKLDELKTKMLEDGEYGQSFPQRFAVTPYRHSAAPIVFTPDEVESLGVMDFDADADGAFGNWEGKEMHKIEDIPDHINDVGDEWVGRTIWDPVMKRPFGILKPELEFYRKMNIPVPREHFIARIETSLWPEVLMMSQHETSCKKCEKIIEVADSRAYPNRKIYCRTCYLQYLEERG
ncbi:MAG: hypothetical protein O2877_00790 [bacterium]|nr:hypothetical protein [bacterium]